MAFSLSSYTEDSHTKLSQFTALPSVCSCLAFSIVILASIRLLGANTLRTRRLYSVTALMRHEKRTADGKTEVRQGTKRRK